MKRRHYSRQHPGLATNTRPQALTMPSPNGATVNCQACKRLENMAAPHGAACWATLVPSSNLHHSYAVFSVNWPRLLDRPSETCTLQDIRLTAP